MVPRVAKLGAASLGLLAGAWLAFSLAHRAPDAPPAPPPSPPPAVAAAAPTSSGGRVRIDAVEPEEQVPGGLVVLRGRGFSIFPSDDALQDIASYRRALAAVSVTAGGLAAPPNELADGRAQVLLPSELPLGRQRIVLRLGEEWAAAEVAVVSRLAVPQVEPGEPVPSFLTLDTPRFSREDGQEVVSFAGGAEGLPDGCAVAVKLAFGAQRLDAGHWDVKGGRFAGEVRPSGMSLFPGAYWVEAQFDLARQTRDVRRRFAAAFPDAAGARRREHAGARRVLQVGTSAEIDACERAHAELIATAATRGRALLEELALAYGAAGRSGFVSGGGVDEGAWSTWLELRALAAFAKAERPARREAMRARRDVLGAEGGLDVEAWRRVADGASGEARSRFEEKSRFVRRFVMVPDLDVIHRVERVLSGIASLSADWSRELYRNASLPPDDAKDPRQASPADVREVLADLDALDRRVAEHASRK